MTLRQLPFTEKQDLRNHYPYGLFAPPREYIVRLHASSGTTGSCSVVGYTARDLENWSEVMARSLTCRGATSRDFAHVAYGYGLFTGGLGAHYGAEEAGVDFRRLPLRVGMFGAEPWSEAMRAEIERKMGIDALNIYGLSEIIGPGVAMECLEAKNGMHIFEDHFLPEIIDPVAGEQLPPGETGELVITTLTKEGIPCCAIAPGILPPWTTPPAVAGAPTCVWAVCADAATICSSYAGSTCFRNRSKPFC